MPLDVIAGRYRVERAIGQGGMGTVWLCQDEVLHRPVAVKQIGSLPGDSATARRAMREARTAAALNHRNAVSIFDIVDHDGAPWLVMEYVPSHTLAEMMQTGPIPPDRLARIAAQVAAALASAHALGIIHRDVKPGNILVGDDDLAKISDFGIARLAHDEQLTQTGMMSGTPAYFSPELARGADPAPESDVWALGATLYAAVEGKAPYPKHTNPIATLQSIASEPVPAPVRAGPLLDPIGHMMDRDPASRWTMAQAEAALRQLAEGPDQSVTEPTTIVPALAEDDRRRSRLLPVLLGVVAVLVLGIGGYLALSALGSDDPRTAPGPSAGPTATGDPATGAPSPEESPEESPVESPQSPDGSPVGAAAAKIGTIESYFATVPDDLDAGWTLLSSDMQQEVGRDSYDSFWSGIQDVVASDVRSVGGDVVDARITYTRSDGSTSVELKRYTLERTGEGYLIADEQTIG